MTKQTTKTTEEATPFKLRLPAELAITPKWEFPVSKNYVAKVFEQRRDTHNRVSGIKDGTETVYRLVVCHKTRGTPPRGYYDRCETYSDTLQLMLAVEYVARSLMPKKSTTVQEVDDAD